MGNCIRSVFKSPLFYIIMTTLTLLSLNVGLNVGVCYLSIYLIYEFIPSYYYLKYILIPVLFLYNYLLLRRIVIHWLFEWQYPFQIFSIYKERQNYIAYLKKRITGFLTSIDVLMNPEYKLTENETIEIIFFLDLFEEELFIYDNLYNIVIANNGIHNNNLIRYKMSQNQINYYNKLKILDNILNIDDFRNKLRNENILNNKIETSIKIEKNKENISILNQIKNVLNNEILPIIAKYDWENYTYMSPAYLYNLIFNDTFGSLSLYSMQFKRNFQEYLLEENYTPNGKIHYTLIRNLKNDNNKELINKNEINIEENSLIKEKENKDDGNLLFFCLPNGGCYELIPKTKIVFYLANGFSFLCWNYRGYGFSKGSCDFSSCKEDALNVFDTITRDNKYRFKKICVMGHSIGGLAVSYLAKNRKVDMVISDRNFCDIPRIAKNLKCGNVLSFLLKSLLIGKTNTIEYLMDENGRNNIDNIIKIIIYSPSDALIGNDCSVKSGIARHVIKNYIFYKNNKSKDNFLDLALNSTEKNLFLNNLIELIHINHDIAIDFKKDDIIQYDYTQNENDLIFSESKDKYDKNDITFSFLGKFLGICCDDLTHICQYPISIRRQKLFLESFFNNLLIWGAIGEENFANEENFEFYSYKGIKIVKEACDILDKNNLDENLIEENIINNNSNRKNLLINNIKISFKKILNVMQNLEIDTSRINNDNKRDSFRISNLNSGNFKEKLIMTEDEEEDINTNNTNNNDINTKLELSEKNNLISDSSNKSDLGSINLNIGNNFYQKLNDILGNFKLFRTCVGHNGSLNDEEKQQFYYLLLKSGIIN